MAARAGLATLIERLRSMTDAGTADYDVAGETHWSDDQLQAVLDAHRADFVRDALRAAPEYVADGAAEYRDYYTSRRNLEEAASGSAAWDLEDGSGESVDTADYTVSYDASHIRFAADTEGASYYLSGRAYNLNRAAAVVWERKAAHAAAGYGFTADGATYRREQAYQHCLEMAQHYRGLGGVKVGRLFRSDA